MSRCLKVGRFEPEYLGKLSFYLEALDRDARKHIKILQLVFFFVRAKIMRWVEYSLNRTVSPALIAEYKIQCRIKAIAGKTA